MQKRILELFNSLIIIGFIASTSLSAKENVAFDIDGKKVSMQELESSAGQDLFEAQSKLYDIQINYMNKYLLSYMIKNDPLSKGLTEQAFVNQYIIKPVTITETEIKNFAKSQHIPDNKLDTPLLNRIKNYLSTQHFRAQVDSWLAERLKKHKLTNYLIKPIAPKRNIAIANAPFRGSKTAQVTLVEFSDFQCPYCGAASKIVHDVLKKYDGKIRFVYKQFPLNTIHQYAQKAAEASLCVRKLAPDTFWNMHDALFADQKHLTIADLKKKASTLKIDQLKFDQCLTSGEMATEVQKDIKEGLQLGIRSTPTFYINGRLLSAHRSLSDFSKEIDSLLKNKD